LLIAGAAVALRTAYPAIGVIAFVPWIFLNLLAVSEAPGTLSAFYAYPIMLSVGWLPIGLALNARASMPRQITYVAFFAFVIATTVIANPQVPAFFRGSIPSDIALHPRPLRDFVTALEESLPSVSNVRADASIISLTPNSFTQEAWLLPQDWPQVPLATDVEMLVFFRNGFERPKAMSQLNVMHDPHIYELPQTNIVVVTAGPLNPKLPLGQVLRPISSPLG